MSDDLSKRGKPDRSKVAGSEPWEVEYMARVTHSTPAQVREAVKKVGPDRDRVREELQRRK